MKTKITKRIVAAACALTLTACSSAAVFANDNADSNKQPNVDQPKQEMMKDQAPSTEQYAPQGEKPDGEPKDQLPEMQDQSTDQNAPQGEKPDGEPKGEKPDGEPKDQLPEMQDLPQGEKPDGEAPGEGGGMQDLFKKVAELVSGSTLDSINSLLEQYKNAVDTERESTDETEKLTAAGLVKDLMDAINAALEAAGVDFRVTVPTDKPENQVK